MIIELIKVLMEQKEPHRICFNCVGVESHKNKAHKSNLNPLIRTVEHFLFLLHRPIWLKWKLRCNKLNEKLDSIIRFRHYDRLCQCRHATQHKKSDCEIVEKYANGNLIFLNSFASTETWYSLFSPFRLKIAGKKRNAKIFPIHGQCMSEAFRLRHVTRCNFMKML